MSSVWKAHDRTLQRDVAVKFLSPDLLSDPSSTARVRREARALARLRNPHIATVHDLEENDGNPFIVMEFVEGEPLTRLIGSSSLNVQQVCKIGVDVATGLRCAHMAGIVHRDIKPANVIVQADTAVLIDFGIARMEDSDEENLTKAYQAIGTAAYMSPEQAKGEEATAASDMYALGCLLYAMFSGEPPFRQTNANALLYAQACTPAPPLATVSTRTPMSLCRLVDSLLAKDPVLRPGAQDVIDELSRNAEIVADAPTTVLPAHRHVPTQEEIDANAVTQIVPSAVLEATQVMPSGTVLPRVVQPAPPAPQQPWNGWEQDACPDDRDPRDAHGPRGARPAGSDQTSPEDVPHLRRLDDEQDERRPSSRPARRPSEHDDGLDFHPFRAIGGGLLRHWRGITGTAVALAVLGGGHHLWVTPAPELHHNRGECVSSDDYELCLYGERSLMFQKGRLKAEPWVEFKGDVAGVLVRVHKIGSGSTSSPSLRLASSKQISVRSDSFTLFDIDSPHGEPVEASNQAKNGVPLTILPGQDVHYSLLVDKAKRAKISCEGDQTVTATLTVPHGKPLTVTIPALDKTCPQPTPR